jgi:uncharacterized protein (UPF0261 family)
MRCTGARAGPTWYDWIVACILIIGAFDTKGEEYAFLREQILARGHSVVALNTGVMGSTKHFPVDIEAHEVAQAGGGNLAALREKKDRGEAMAVMARGAEAMVKRLHDQGKFDGIIGMGGSAGTAIITTAMRALPIGVPKVCVSTVASGNTSPYVGAKDVVLFPAIVDVAGINRISRMIYSRAAGAICGMVEGEAQRQEGTEARSDKPIIAATMFGNTTECVNACREALTRSGYEVLVFHATGTGGRTMESLVDEGLVDAVLDITTTEWADEVAGGVFSAGADRLSAPGRKGLPHLIVPGCVDMVNFGPMETVPQKYKDAKRKFYPWNPAVTLMRTNIEENHRMGEIFAKKANEARGPVAFLIPLRGVSILDGDGQPFCDRAADNAMFDGIKSGLRKNIPVVEMDVNINDPKFAAKAVDMMLELIAKR